MSEHRTITAMGGPFVTVGTSPSARGDRDMGLRICAGESSISAILSPDGARQLRDALTAWLDAPRLAARATAEVVASDDGYRLLRTPFEWGVSFVGNDEPVQSPGELWFGGDNAEREASKLFAEERGKVCCFGCSVEVDEDESELGTEDGDRYCADCSRAARKAFNASTFSHNSGSHGDHGCEWRGAGSEIVDIDEDALCPRCGAPVQVERYVEGR